MELPFIVTFEPPSWAELRAWSRLRRTWAAVALVLLAVGSPLGLLLTSRAEAGAEVVRAELSISSVPSGATVTLDGRLVGTTPLTIDAAPGPHQALLTAADAVDVPYAVQAGSDAAPLHAFLWRRQPTLTRLRAALPGAVLRDVRPLADGQLALLMASPAERQSLAWRLDPRSAALQPLFERVPGVRLTVAPDGTEGAYLGDPIGPPARGTDRSDRQVERGSVLWFQPVDSTAPTNGWQPLLSTGELLTDVSWSPLGDRLLVVSSVAATSTSSRSRLWLVNASTLVARELLSVPSDIAPGSFVWSPDGRRAVFVARSGSVSALCVIDDSGQFRYLADLDPTPSGATPGIPPAAWSPDGQQVGFVAPPPRPSGLSTGWLQPEATRAVYVATLPDVVPRQLQDTVAEAIGWREDGQPVGLGRQGQDGVLDLRLLAAPGNSRLATLGLRPGVSFDATWDLAHAQLVVVNRAADGALEFWLVQLGLDGAA